MEVPTLRGLRELERAEAPAATVRAWGERQRVAFVLATVAVAALAVAGYLTLRLPAQPVVPQLPEIDQNTPIHAVLLVFEDLERGLDAMPPGLTAGQRAIVDRRNSMLWGIGIAAAIAVCTAVGAVVVLSGGRKKR